MWAPLFNFWISQFQWWVWAGFEDLKRQHLEFCLSSPVSLELSPARTLYNCLLCWDSGIRGGEGARAWHPSTEISGPLPTPQEFQGLCRASPQCLDHWGRVSLLKGLCPQHPSLRAGLSILSQNTSSPHSSQPDFFHTSCPACFLCIWASKHFLSSLGLQRVPRKRENMIHVEITGSKRCYSLCKTVLSSGWVFGLKPTSSHLIRWL